jgi:hypothetical protein
MAISPELKQFKSSGVYRLEFDKSQTVNVPQETIRLIVGHSTTGPYNTPVFVENTEQFIQAFGSADKNLERRGMYFHRSALEALSRGPILAVNLLNTSPNDIASWASLATNGSKQGLSSLGNTSTFSSFHDTERFWIPTDEKLLRVVKESYSIGESEVGMQDRTLNFVNIKQDPITVIVRQASDTRGFEITAREWYGEGNQPEGVDPLDYISEYMVDVLVFKGKFEASELNNDPVYGTYFDEDGLIKDKLAGFANLREVSLIANYTGSLIPDFIDLEGRQLYIEALINLETRKTGLFCAVNEDATATVDLVGDAFDVYQDYEVLSHIVKQDTSLDALGAIASTDVDLGDSLVRTIDSTTIEIYGSSVSLPEGKFLDSLVSGEYAMISSVTVDADKEMVTIITSGEDVADLSNFTAESVFSAQSATSGSFVTPTTLRIMGAVSLAGTDLTGKFIDINNTGTFYKVTSVASPAPDQFDIVFNVDATASGLEALINGYDFSLGLSWNVKETAASNLISYYSIGLNSRAVEFPETTESNQNANWDFNSLGAGVMVFSTTVAAEFPTEIKVGQYMSIPGGKLSKILQIIKSTEQDGNTTIDKVTIVGHRDNLGEAPTFAFKSFDDATISYKTFPLLGSNIETKNIKELLAILVPGDDKGFANTLVDKDAITFRYLVDTFGSISEDNNEIFNKVEFTQLARERQNASAILNAPMVTELRRCSNPTFVDTNDVFKAKYISTGGNLDSNPSNLYAMPEVLEGANYGFYYGPGLVVMESGKRKIIPPAAYVSNNFIDKYTSSLPWSIVAGPRRGVVTGTNVQTVEYAFDKLDRDVVEPFGINPIVFERGVGLVVKGNKTAQQKITSALSSAHVREALIYIEDGLAAILQNYLFEFNTAQTRLEIKTLADAFMEAIKKDGGVYDYRNIMDTTNNTNEVIDANMGVIDTYVEPVKGLEILVSRVTVLNTGEIATGNFS